MHAGDFQRRLLLFTFTVLGGKPCVWRLSVAICFAKYHISGGQGPLF